MLDHVGQVDLLPGDARFFERAFEQLSGWTDERTACLVLSVTRLLADPPPTLLWLAIAGPLSLEVLVVGAGWWRRGDRVLGTCLGAVAMLLASPISWSHHWVWAVPVALALWERNRWASFAWTAVFVARPIVWPPYARGREYGWGPAEHLVGNAYLLAALALSVWAAATLNRRDRAALPVRDARS